MKRATPVLAGVLESEARGWFAPFRERAITELQSQGLDDEQIRRSACAAVQEEYLRRVLAAVRASPPLEELGEGVCRLLAENAQSVVLMQRAVENVSQKLASFQKSLRHFIDTHHPVRSRIDAWVRHKFRAAESRFALEHQWAAHEEALALCKENGLQQTAYFLQRDLTFMREREPVLQKELQRVKTPTREFEWRAHIWLWSNWTVYRRFQGDSKAIPTVISQTSTSITNPRNNPSEPVFVLEKEVVRTTTTRWLFWRWCNFVHRLWSWGSNGFYLLGVVIPWSSPVSLRALLCVEPFTPDLELSQVNGTLCPRRSSLTPTLTSRLVSLWRHISKSRTEFETRPDTGFIGKEMTRHLNRVWNYALKGAVGTLLLVTLFPAVCLVTSLVSLLLAAAVPLWAPAAVLLFHLFLVLCYDFDSPSPERNRWCVLLEALVWHVGVLGVLQPLAALLVAGVVCPLLALAVLVYGWLRWCCRRLWDRVAYDAVVSRKGRIPCSDSMLVTRVHGPGLSSDYYLQIRAEQALAAFEARLEADELAAFARQTARRIEQPQTACAAFVSRVLSPFSAQLSGTGVYGKLCEEAKQLNSTLQERIEKRQYDLQTALTPAQRRKVKLTPRDLQLTLVAGARMLEDFYPSHVLARLSAAAEGAGDVTDDVTGDAAAFWEGRGLAVGDWAGLSAQVLTEVFSADVLTPLHHTDTHFYLEVHRVSLHRYTELLRRAAAVPVPVPLVQTAAHIQVAAPALELAVFSPSAGRGRDRSASGHRSASRRLRPWKRQRTSAIYTAEKLAARLPLPHPLRVALTVYNREADSPVCAEDDPACRRLLAALESVTTAHAQIEGDGAVLSESLERESEEGRESVGHVEVSVDEGGGGDSASVDDSRREYTIDSTSGYRIDDDVVQIAHNPIAGTSQPSRWTSIPLGSSIVTPPAGAGAGTGHSRDPSLASIDFITVRLSELAMMDSGEDHGDLRSQSLRTTDV